MLEYAVVTLTNGTRKEWLDQAADAIQKNLPPGASHFVVPCPTPHDFLPCRLAALRLAKYVSFADDDDIVINDSLRKCLEAVKEHQASVAFTDEIVVDTHGNDVRLEPLRNGLLYSHVVNFVRTIHHTSVIETSSVKSDVETIATDAKCPSGIDWLIHGTAALNGSAVHLPIYGNKWRHHEKNMHRENRSSFYEASFIFKRYLGTFLKENSLIKRLEESFYYP